jgi:prophage antirepressor-like protein
MKSLTKSLKSRETTYISEIDFVFFTHKLDKKQLYLTYEGMIKVLYSSKSGKAKSFRNWATKTLFTVQIMTSK